MAADLQLDGRHAFPLLGLVAAVGVWYLWGNQGKTHTSENAATIAFSPAASDPYAWWKGHGHLGPKHFCYPERMLMNTSPATLQESEGTLSVAQAVVGNG